MSDTGTNIPDLPEFQPGGDAIRLTARQIAVQNYLEKKIPGLGFVYFGVLFALTQDRNPERFVQAAHSLRQLTRQLRTFFPGLPGDFSPSLSHKKLEELAALFKANPTDKELREKVSEVNDFYEQTLIKRTERFALFIEKASEGGAPNENDKRRAAEALRELEKWLDDLAHHSPRTQVTESEFRNRLDEFEAILEVLISEYFAIESRVEQLMKKRDVDRSDVAVLQKLLLRPRLYDFFFRNLENCEWLTLLKEAGYFRKPVDILNHEGGSISCPSWPQSAFLLRCVDSEPDLVAEILNEVEETINARVHQELVEVALRLPPKLAAQFSKKAKHWIRDRYHMITLLPIRLSELAAKLAEGGDTSAAIDVAETILDLRIDEDKYKSQKNTSFIHITPDAESFVSEWLYSKMIETLELPLAQTDPLGLIKVLCNKLSKAIRLEHKTVGKSEDASDYTFIHRPAIEDHEQNTGTDRLKDHLINHIRDLSVALVQNGSPIEDLLVTLRSFRYPIFRRLELHLLCKFPEISHDHIVTWLSDENNFNSRIIHHEFYRLLEKTFGRISPNRQKIYFDWVSQGPDIEEYKSLVKQGTGKDPSEAQVESYAAEWKLKRYKPIEAHLRPGDRAVYSGLLSSYNQDEHPEFVTFSQNWVGPTSPLNDEQLTQMSVDEVLRYLAEWNPPAGHFVDSREGLARFFKDDVKSRAIEYAAVAGTIHPVKLKPVYLYYLFSGFEEAVKDRKQLPWSKVLQLADLITFNDNLPEPDKSADEFETGWKGVRKEIASLLSEALKDSNLIPFEFKKEIWKIIEKLTHEDNPTRAFEEQYGGSNMSPVDLSINTARGEAVHAFFRYLLWVDRNLNVGKEPDKQEHRLSPEALPVLERLLDTTQEQTLTIRSVVGWYLQNLAYLDLAWVKSHLDSILPEQPGLVQLRNATFEGYFSFNQPNGFLFRNLREVFGKAFNWANDLNSADGLHRPKQNYVYHTAVYYWWGLDPLTTEDCLIKRLFVNGNLKLRVEAVESIGRSLETLLPIVPGGPEALRRLQELLDWRLSHISQSALPEGEKIEELKEFGWWFTYAQMDKNWLLDRLVQALRITKGRIEWGHKVLERLIEFIPNNPLKVAQSVDAIVSADPYTWNIDFWQKQLDALFQGIKEAGSQEAWGVCRHTINFLGEKGFRSFGALL